jgi:hypothetical protein
MTQQTDHSMQHHHSSCQHLAKCCLDAIHLLPNQTFAELVQLSCMLADQTAYLGVVPVAELDERSGWQHHAYCLFAVAALHTSAAVLLLCIRAYQASRGLPATQAKVTVEPND